MTIAESGDSFYIILLGKIYFVLIKINYEPSQKYLSNIINR